MGADPVVQRLRAFKAERSFVGAHNQADADRGWSRVDFEGHARPLDHEWA